MKNFWKIDSIFNKVVTKTILSKINNDKIRPSLNLPGENLQNPQ
jgi:hypothetical protein